MRRLMLTLLTLLILLTSCATQKGKREKSLDLVLTAYASALRWNGFEDGLTFIDPDYLKAHPMSTVDLQRYRQVRVSYYHANPPALIGTDDVQQLVEIGVVNEHSQNERAIVDRQHWHWDTVKERWWLVSGLPDITHHE